MKRASLKQPEPVQPRPRPPLKPRPNLQKVKALYEYTAQDLDELTIAPGDIIELIRERKKKTKKNDPWLFIIFAAFLDESGWWTGRNKGKSGLFPGNYVEKM